MKFIIPTCIYGLIVFFLFGFVACANRINGTGNTIKNQSKIENNASVSFPNLLK